MFARLCFTPNSSVEHIQIPGQLRDKELFFFGFRPEQFRDKVLFAMSLGVARNR